MDSQVLDPIRVNNLRGAYRRLAEALYRVPMPGQMLDPATGKVVEPFGRLPEHEAVVQALHDMHVAVHEATL